MIKEPPVEYNTYLGLIHYNLTSLIELLYKT